MSNQLEVISNNILDSFQKIFLQTIEKKDKLPDIPITQEQFINLFDIYQKASGIENDKNEINYFQLNKILQSQLNVLKSLLQLSPQILASVPIKDKTISKEIRSKYLKYFQVIVRAFRFLNLSQQYLNDNIDDSYKHVEILRALSKDKREIQVLFTLQNSDKMNNQVINQLDGNITLILNVFDKMTDQQSLKQIWSIFDSLQEILGKNKVGSVCFDIGMFKLLYKFMMSSSLAITQQTQSAIAKINQSSFDPDLDLQSQELVKFKNQFILDGGIKQLKKVIDESFFQRKYEIYFYSVSIIQPLIFNLDLVNTQQASLINKDWAMSHEEILAEFHNQKYVTTLIQQIISFFERKSTQLKYLAPVFLSIKSIIQQNYQLREEFIQNEEGLETLLLIVSQSFGHDEFKNIYISGLILMCQLQIQQADQKSVQFKFDDLIDQKMKKIEIEYQQMESESQGKKILAHENLNRLQNWREKFLQAAQTYNLYWKIVKQQFEFNIGHDDQEIINGFNQLSQLFLTDHISKSFLITDFGAFERYILSSLQNLDEQIMLSSLICLKNLIILQRKSYKCKDEGAQDLLIKRQGVQILKICMIDEMLEIRKASLEIVGYLASQKEEVLQIYLDIGIVEICKQYVECYPDELIDIEVFSLSLDVLLNIIKLLPQILNDNFLNVPFQLQCFLQEIQNQNNDSILAQQENIIKKLCKLVCIMSKQSQEFQGFMREQSFIKNLLPYIQYGIQNMSNFQKKTIYTESVMQNLIKIIIQFVQEIPENQNYIIENYSAQIIKIIQDIIIQNEYLDLAGQTCLLISSLLQNKSNQKAQKMFCNELIIERLIFLSDFNQLINESDPEASVDSLQTISFFSFLALINLSKNNYQAQKLIGELGGIEVIIKLLKNGVYEPKKTSCICLSNLLQGQQNKYNQEILVKSNGVSLLTELINDEDFNEVSEIAYECLQHLGPLAIQQLFHSLQCILSQRDYYWNEKNSIIIDVIDGQERHLCTLKDLIAIPNPRDFGIQDLNDLIDQRQFQILEKIIPVINGLLYGSKDNRLKVISDNKYLKSLFDIFRYQIPIELYENALFTCLNILQDCNKQKKQEMNDLGLIRPILIFLNDLNQIEKEILINKKIGINNQITVFADYNEEWNPQYSSIKKQKAQNNGIDLTLDEMQEKILKHQIYIWKVEEQGTFKVDQKNPFAHKKVDKKESLSKEKIISHIQGLRSIGYSIISQIQNSNTKLLLEILKNYFPNLIQTLKQDIVNGLIPFSQLFDNFKQEQNHHEIISYELVHEAIDLLCNIIGIKELFKFQEQQGINIQFLETLLTFCQKNTDILQTKIGYQSPQKLKLVQSQILQAINERKGIN